MSECFDLFIFLLIHNQAAVFKNQLLKPQALEFTPFPFNITPKN